MSWFNSPLVLVTIAGAIVTCGVLAYENRREIRRLKDWAFGHGESESGGRDATIQDLADQLDQIEEAISDDRLDSAQSHRELREEVKTNRILTVVTTRNLVEVIRESIDEDLDEEDIQPDWVDDEAFGDEDGPGKWFDGGGERQTE